MDFVHLQVADEVYRENCCGNGVVVTATSSSYVVYTWLGRRDIAGHSESWIWLLKFDSAVIEILILLPLTQIEG